MHTLHLKELIERNMVGLSPYVAGSLMEAGEYCLMSQAHAPKTKIYLKGICTDDCELDWDGILNDQMKASWNDTQEATEKGAVALSILAAINFTDFIVVERSSKGTGFDYYLGTDDADEFPFERMARLEISGIWKGQLKDIRKRLKEKTDQISVSNYMGMPAYVGIVEFSKPSLDLVLV